MPSCDNEIFSEYKKLEEEWNIHLKKQLNCRLFVVLADKFINDHLDQVECSRAIVKDWLDSNNMVDKEEVVNLAKIQISIESKMDDYDDLIYVLEQKCNYRKKSLLSLEQLLLDLRAMIKDEYQSIRSNKIKSLNEELLEIKSLFY